MSWNKPLWVIGVIFSSFSRHFLFTAVLVFNSHQHPMTPPRVQLPSTYMKPCCYQLPHTKHLIVVFLNTNLIFLWPLCSLPDNTAWILTRRGGWSQQDQTVFYLPIFISDSEQPVQSSTSTLTIRVCSCDQEGNVMSCNAEAYSLPASLSRGALIAILACIFVLLGELLLRWCANNRVS